MKLRRLSANEVPGPLMSPGSTPSTALWSCAANASLYIEDHEAPPDVPAGVTMMGGSPDLGREGWTDAYVACFMFDVLCQPGVVAAAALYIARRRFTHQTSDVALVAVTIAERSIAMLVESGAATDLDARRRLLSSMQLRAYELVFGKMLPVPELLVGPRQDWVEEQLA